MKENDSIYLFFQELDEASKQDGFIDIEQFAVAYGYTEGQIESLAKEDEENEEILGIVKLRIVLRAEELLCRNQIDEETYVKTMKKYDFFCKESERF